MTQAKRGEARAMNRRILLKGVAGLGAAAGVGALARFGLLAPPRSDRLESVDALASRVFSMLSEDARRRAYVAFDDPLRHAITAASAWAVSR